MTAADAHSGEVPTSGTTGPSPRGTMTAVTRSLCEKIRAIDYHTLPAPVIAAARQLFLDGLAVAVAGAEEDAIQILADHYRAYEARPEATALGQASALHRPAPRR